MTERFPDIDWWCDPFNNQTHASWRSCANISSNCGAIYHLLQRNVPSTAALFTTLCGDHYQIPLVH